MKIPVCVCVCVYAPSASVRYLLTDGGDSRGTGHSCVM